MSLEPFVRYSRNVEGKITIATVFFCVLVISVFFFADVQYKEGIQAQSDVATTSVFVVNSPPEWVVDPAEIPASSTSTPTNEGDIVTWQATAFDPNGTNSYWLLICKNTTATETDMVIHDPDLNTPPDCFGGESNRWARSELTADGQVATATYQTSEGRVEDVENDWYAFICDNDEWHPRCNVTDVKQGDGASGSPFYVNHRPVFTEVTNPDPTDPGGVATWTSVASNTNSIFTDLTVKLFICRENQFDEENVECNGGTVNTYASSTFSLDPSVNYTTKHPKPDGEYDAYGFIVDAYGLTAPLPTDVNYNGQEDRVQGTSTNLTINNVSPELEVATVEFYDYNNDTETPSSYFNLINEEDETDGFRVKFETSDANSCVTKDWESGTTTNYIEMTDVAVNIYRSGIGVNNCYLDGHYNSNNCYPFDVATSSYETEEGWGITCTLDSSNCTGDTDTNVAWECTFPLWFLADPTYGTATTSQYYDQSWVASAVVTDDDSATSTLTQGTGVVDMYGFLAFRLNQDTITFGDLEVGDRNDPLDRVTTVFATGNVGVDQELEGTPMCPGFDLLDTTEYGCSVYDPDTGTPEDTIPARFQRFAKGLLTAYDSGTQLADVTAGGDPAFLALNVLKTTSITSIENEDMGWGIEIHGDITRAGNYLGQNTFIGVASDASNW